MSSRVDATAATDYTTPPRPCGTGCTTRNHHTPTCTTPCTCNTPGPCGHCRGCEPAPAAYGLTVCRTCRNRTVNALDALPGLYDDLLDPSRPGGKQPGPPGTEKPLPIRVGADADHPGPSEHRTAIAQELARLVLTLLRDYGTPPPRVSLYGALQGAVDDRLHAKFAAMDAADREATTNQTSPRARHADTEHAALPLLRKVIAADHRIARLARTLDRTDPVEQHARHIAVDKNLDRLLGRDDAPTTVTTLTGLAWTARRLAAPTRPQAAPLGACPTCTTPVRAHTTPDGTITCPTCGLAGDLDWWHTTLTTATGTNPAATTEDLSAWLSHLHRTPVTETAIRKWGSRHPHLKTGTADRDGRSLYDVRATLAYARTLYAPTTATSHQEPA